jgi:hypothetical protein
MENLIFKMSILSNLGEGKEIPVEACPGPEGSRRLRFEIS